jgi:hypothetical protein
MRPYAPEEVLTRRLLGRASQGGRADDTAEVIQHRSPGVRRDDGPYYTERAAASLRQSLMRADLGTSAHPADDLVAGNSMLVAEFLKLLAINIVGQNPQRLVGFLLVPEVTQGVHYPLPAKPHMHHRASLRLNVR